ncbi:MAG: hypothetical protein ACK4K8_00345 [Pannonibacter sp.]
MRELFKINREQQLYVMTAGHGYSCLGFDVAEKWRVGVLRWLGEDPKPMRKGTKRHYSAYVDAMARGQEHNRQTGKRCPILLESRLIGLEGTRIQVVYPEGEKRRFYVGRSMGWLPVHLEIMRRNSTGGSQVYLPEGAKVQLAR